MPTVEMELGSLVFPEAGPVPGVVLIHDVWGLADHTRDLAGRLAGEGFSVLALDLYRREAEVKIDNPGVWMRGLSDPQAIADVEEAAVFLRAHESVGNRKVGVIGFCMGGMYALLAACGSPGIDASVAYYGLLSHAHGILYDEA
ncbi:MAG: dienelactone hydrolase family protein, partial [Myxococcota bacterium]|nr:dienelactone hydrolase family protein [Myxococcota bacterium]